MPQVVLESCLGGLFVVRFDVDSQRELAEVGNLLGPLMRELDDLYRTPDQPGLVGYSQGISIALADAAQLILLRDQDPNVEVSNPSLTLRVPKSGFSLLVSHLGQAGVFLDIATPSTMH